MLKALLTLDFYTKNIMATVKWKRISLVSQTVIIRVHAWIRGYQLVLKQPMVTLSTTEAEFIVVASCAAREYG